MIMSYVHRWTALIIFATLLVSCYWCDAVIDAAYAFAESLVSRPLRARTGLTCSGRSLSRQLPGLIILVRELRPRLMTHCHYRIVSLCPNLWRPSACLLFWHEPAGRSRLWSWRLTCKSEC